MLKTTYKLLTTMECHGRFMDDAQGHVSVPSKQRHRAGAVEVGKAPLLQGNFSLEIAGLIFRGKGSPQLSLDNPRWWVCGGNFWHQAFLDSFPTLEASEFSDQKLPLLMAELHLSWIKRYAKHEWNYPILLLRHISNHQRVKKSSWRAASKMILRLWNT